jgi:hypothetical protein
MCLPGPLADGAHTRTGRPILRSGSRLRSSPHSPSRILETGERSYANSFGVATDTGFASAYPVPKQMRWTGTPVRLISPVAPQRFAVMVKLDNAGRRDVTRRGFRAISERRAKAGSSLLLWQTHSAASPRTIGTTTAKCRMLLPLTTLGTGLCEPCE